MRKVLWDANEDGHDLIPMIASDMDMDHGCVDESLDEEQSIINAAQ